MEGKEKDNISDPKQQSPKQTIHFPPQCPEEPTKDTLMVTFTKLDALFIRASQVALVKVLPANAEDLRDVGLIPRLGRSPGIGNGNPLQYSCLEIPRQRSLLGYGTWSYKESGTTE